MRGRALLVILLALCASGCASFTAPEARETTEKNARGEIVMGQGYIRRGRTVEAKGEFRDGAFIAKRVEIEEPDKKLTLKGPLTAWTPGESGSVGGVTFRIVSRSRLRGRDGKEAPPAAFEPGQWVKAECRVLRGGGRDLRKITLRDRKPDELAQIQGEVTHARQRRRRFEIQGVEVTYDPGLEVVWDVEGVAPPPPGMRQLGVAELNRMGLRRVRRRDDEDRRPDEQLTIGNFLTIGGEVQYDSQWRDNHNLNSRRERDRLLHDLSTKLEFSFDIHRHLFAFAQVKADRRWAQFDEGRDLDDSLAIDLGEAYVFIEDLPPGFALQVGRQDFDHGREWVMDENLDAARGYFNLQEATLELSVSSVLFDAGRQQDDITNYLAALHAEPIEDQEFFLYWLHRDGGILDLERHHMGLSGEGEIGRFDWWGDVGFDWGREGGQDLFGWGFDVAAMYTFKSPVRPYLFAGIAMGSGDDDPTDGVDNNFRQTGINDNNDKFGGVTSYRYLGELVRPDLYNLMVLTLGVGFRPTRRTSVDLVFHNYRQVEAAPFLGRSRLRRMPTGLSKDLGFGLDLVVGVDEFSPLEMELVLSWFRPGNAFDGDGDAWFATLQIEYNF